MIEVRPFAELGRFDNDWLNARYHFSFGNYHDPARDGLGPLLFELDLDQYVDDFNSGVIGAYQEGTGSISLPADLGVARSLVPAGTGALRDFSYVAPQIPEFVAE